MNECLTSVRLFTRKAVSILNIILLPYPTVSMDIFIEISLFIYLFNDSLDSRKSKAAAENFLQVISTHIVVVISQILRKNLVNTLRYVIKLYQTSSFGSEFLDKRLVIII